MSQSPRFKIVQRDNTDSAAAAGRLAKRQVPVALRSFEESVRDYQIDQELERAINTSLVLGAPLLLTGDPGTGKTSVAYYLQAYFKTELFDFQVKSTSKANDLKYEFDAVAYLRSAQAPKEIDREELLQKRALWLAFEAKEPAVLLIDEIDKAPRDFPNDLLQELDKHKFIHPFRKPNAADAWIKARSDQPPIVVITSNAERRLPDAFLRRCVHHRLDLTRDLIERAVAARRETFALDDAIITRAIDRFFKLRDKNLDKKPATAELLAWLVVLGITGTDLAALESPDHELPGLDVLIKTGDDLKSLRK